MYGCLSIFSEYLRVLATHVDFDFVHNIICVLLGRHHQRKGATRNILKISSASEIVYRFCSNKRKVLFCILRFVFNLFSLNLNVFVHITRKDLSLVMFVLIFCSHTHFFFLQRDIASASLPWGFNTRNNKSRERYELRRSQQRLCHKKLSCV